MITNREELEVHKNYKFLHVSKTKDGLYYYLKKKKFINI